MSLFSKVSSKNATHHVRAKSISSKDKSKPRFNDERIVQKDKPSISSSAIKAKLHQRKLEEQKSKEEGAAKNKVEAKTDHEKGFIFAPNNVVKDNNPDATEVREKLKGALSSNMVNFSGREKEILGKILQKA
ncbi:MAG: hypothetical protein ACOCUH_01845 [Bacteriovoracia bacterium]